MERLTDFKPLGRVVLPDLGELKCSGLIVLVGPNSSGKSQFLKDLYGRLAGEPRQLVVAEDLRVNKPPFEPFMKRLEAEGYFSTQTNDGGQSFLRPQTMYFGIGQPLGEIQSEHAKNWYDSFTPSSQNSKSPIAFLNHFGRLLVTALFLERRLTSLGSTGVIDFLNQSPQHDLHALHVDDLARKRLLDEMLNSFGRGVWSDTSRGNQIALKVGEESSTPSAEDRLSHKKMAEFRTIESEGDGMKSYVATCVALLLGRRPVCLIDEPEMCLHPPQAYNLGRFIGRYGAGTETVTFVATHSSHLLRGIIQTTKDVQIVRLTRRARRFSAHLVPSEALTEALSRPTLRAESVLDGIFSQAVIVLEADTDRVVYQAVWETLHEVFKTDVHFSTVGGTGGIADTCGLYKTLRIPIAVIADLDMLVDYDKMKRVLEQLIAEPNRRQELLDETREVAECLRMSPPPITPEELGAELNNLSSAPRDWENRDDVELKRRLSRLIHRLDRMRRLKKGGVSALSDDLATRIRTLLRCLGEMGLFLVPVGELEEWLTHEKLTASKSNKWAWANAAAERILHLGRQSGDIWDFVDSIGRYLTSPVSAGVRSAVPTPSPVPIPG